MNFFLIALLFVSVSAKTQTKNNFDWLLGNWKMSSSKGLIIERWEKQNDSLYNGFSALVKQKDTIPEESIELKRVGNDWFFIPTTLHQNEGNPIVFKLIFNKNKEFICENIEHYFPQRINYRLFAKNLLASIEGKVNNEFKKTNYNYIKQH